MERLQFPLYSTGCSNIQDGWRKGSLVHIPMPCTAGLGCVTGCSVPGTEMAFPSLGSETNISIWYSLSFAEHLYFIFCAGSPDYFSNFLSQSLWVYLKPNVEAFNNGEGFYPESHQIILVVVPLEEHWAWSQNWITDISLLICKRGWPWTSLQNVAIVSIKWNACTQILKEPGPKPMKNTANSDKFYLSARKKLRSISLKFTFFSDLLWQLWPLTFP